MASVQSILSGLSGVDSHRVVTLDDGTKYLVVAFKNGSYSTYALSGSNSSATPGIPDAVSEALKGDGAGGGDGDGGSGSGSGGGSGGGSSDKMTWSEFQKMARIVYYQLGIKYNAAIAKAAYNYKKAKIDNSGDFLTYIRRYDKTYVKSKNYQERAYSLLEVYKAYNPNSKKTMNDMRKLVAKGVTANILKYKIEHSAWYKQAYKYLPLNPDLSLEQYRQQTFGIKDVLNRTYGPDQTRKNMDLDMRAIFKRHLSDDEFRARVNMMIASGTSLQWQDRGNKEAGFNRQEQRQFISRAPGAERQEAQITSAQRAMNSMVTGKQATVSTEREDETKKLVKRI